MSAALCKRIYICQDVYDATQSQQGPTYVSVCSRTFGQRAVCVECYCKRFQTFGFKEGCGLNRVTAKRTAWFQNQKVYWLFFRSALKPAKLFLLHS